MNGAGEHNNQGRLVIEPDVFYTRGALTAMCAAVGIIWDHWRVKLNPKVIPGAKDAGYLGSEILDAMRRAAEPRKSELVKAPPPRGASGRLLQFAMRPFGQKPEGRKKEDGRKKNGRGKRAREEDGKFMRSPRGRRGLATEPVGAP